MKFSVLLTLIGLLTLNACQYLGANATSSTSEANMLGVADAPLPIIIFAGERHSSALVEKFPTKSAGKNNQATWQVHFKNAKQSQLFSRDQFTDQASLQLPDGTVRLATAAKDAKHDALALSYQDTWFSSVYFSGGKPLNLTPFIEQGVLSFDINLESIKSSALDLVVSCGEGCSSKLRLREWALAHEAKGWQHLAIPMQCFAQAGADFSDVSQPFNLEAGGKGQFSVANIRYSVAEQGNFTCPQLSELSTTPATLNEHWAIDWWLPRHQEKVALAQQGNIDLLMIGDSITHGWDNKGAGLATWQQHFGDINSLNIGFGGDRTENVLWRLAHQGVDGISPKLAVIMIGTNNTGHRMEQPHYIAKGVHEIVTELKQQLPNTKLLLLGIFPRGELPTDKLRINNNSTNQLLANIAQQQQILYADINQHFLTDQGELTTEIMPDLLHPNKKGYEIWAQALTPYIDQYVR